MSPHRALLSQNLMGRSLAAWVTTGLAPILIPSLPAAQTAEDFFRPARISQVQMSPDGRSVAGLAPIGDSNEIGLVIIDVETQEPKGFRWRGGHDIYDIRWVSDEHVVFSVIKWGMYAAGLYRANRKAGDIETLLDDRIVVRIVDPMVDHPKDSLVWIGAEYQGKPALATLKKKTRTSSRSMTDTSSANTKTLRGRDVLPAGQTFGVYADHNSAARIILNARNGELRYLHRDHAKETWAPLPLDPEDWRIIDFGSDNQSVYVTGYDGKDTRGLHLYDLKSGVMSETLLRDERYDCDEASRFKFFQDTLIGLTYHRDHPVTVWFNDGIERVQNFIDESLPGRINVVFDWNRDFTRLLIATESPTSPVTYLLLDLTTKEFKPISGSAPWIDQSQLSPSQTIKFRTADGLTLEGYLTTPRTGKPPYPAVNLVHGGPWVRDLGGYDAEAQYLASLGYAVIQVNYRGSSGYGKKVSEDPAYDFRAMHDDITRATQLLIKQKVIDPDRVAIMGASFGGYAALSGVAFEPDLYRCAVTNVGVFDWAEMVKARKRQRNYYSHHKLVEELGDPKNQEAYDTISPIRHAEAIKVPVLIAHGKADGNVSVRQSKRLEAVLKKQGVPHETYYREWQGHGFRGKTRIEYYERVAAFLAEHLDRN